MKQTIYTILIFIISANSVSGFSPIAHMILADSVSGRLPNGNVIKTCMEKYPEIARIGSVGPDLPASSVYLHGMSLFHYHKVGDFAKLLLQDALKPTLAVGFKPENLSEQQKAYIAFAAGWISHIGGDFGSHQFFVYPMAGCYISGNVSERMTHSSQEELIDSWVYTNYAQHRDEYQKIEFKNSNTKKFFKNIIKILVPKEKLGMLNNINYRIDFLVDSALQAQKAKFMKVDQNIKNLLRFGGVIKHLQPNFAFDNTTFYSCLTNKMENRNTLAKNAFEYGINFTTSILIDASNNKYNQISNNWNLDVGPNGDPTYTIVLKFSKTLFSGTRGKLKLILQDKRSKKDTFELTEETIGYQMKHTNEGRLLYELKTSGKKYYFHVYPEGAAARGLSDNSYTKNCPDSSLFNYKQQNLEGFYIQFSKRGVFCDLRLVIAELQLWKNGTIIYEMKKDKHLVMKRKKNSKISELMVTKTQ